MYDVCFQRNKYVVVPGILNARVGGEVVENIVGN